MNLVLIVVWKVPAGHYIHFKAPEGLDQAVLVAKNQDVNLSSIKKWCKNEGAESAFKEFLKMLQNK